MDKEEFIKIAKYYRSGDNALIAIQDNDNSVIIHRSTKDIDDVFMEVLSKYIESQFSNFDGIQHDCIDFYRVKFNKLFDDLESELM